MIATPDRGASDSMAGVGDGSQLPPPGPLAGDRNRPQPPPGDVIHQSPGQNGDGSFPAHLGRKGTVPNPAHQLALATNNAKKLTELRRLVAEQHLHLEVLGLADLPAYPEPAETERTFEGNALLKARACREATGLPALADDSGIEVDLLNKMPGVRSARWAGKGASDQQNLDLLIAQLADAEPSDRTGRFVCAVAYADPDGAEHVLRATMEGTLVSTPKGGNGFGYDPIFVADGQTRTNAELTPVEKDAISHRGKAVRAMLEWLAKREG